jgi:hypothetical protein
LIVEGKSNTVSAKIFLRYERRVGFDFIGNWAVGVEKKYRLGKTRYGIKMNRTNGNVKY